MIMHQQAELRCATLRKNKNVSDPFDQEGSEPPSQRRARITTPCSRYTAASLLLTPN